MQVIELDRKEAWREALWETGPHDLYHTPDYTEAELRPGEAAYLLCSGEGAGRVLLPVIVRPVVVGGVARPGLYDATSVYGYGGPLVGSRPDDSTRRRFQADLRDFFADRGVVTVFSRLHPLTEHHLVLEGLGEVSRVGQTVSIDLSLPAEAQFSRYRTNHRRGLRKLVAAGVECREVDHETFLDEFSAIHHDTMRRVGASGTYFLDRAELGGLFRSRDFEAHLFGCFLEGRMICGGIFTLVGGTVQYHLGGTATKYVRLAPTKLLFDTVRLWANGRRARVFHLGGGVGGQEDSLFHFKAGFSDRTHPFRVWKWIVDRPSYDRLCRGREGSGPTAFFPAYREPN